MSIYEQLLPKIVTQFKIVSEDNIDVVHPAKTGFSGAEVYAVELSAPSQYTGAYFLKIDKYDDEFSRCKVSEHFPFAAKYIESAKIDGYYVLLTQIAGNSGIEYKSFYEWPVHETKAFIPKIIRATLKNSFDKQSFLPDRMSLTDICSKLLAEKLSEDGAIAQLVKEHLPDPQIPTFGLGDSVFPNAFYFATNPKSELQPYYLRAPIHGDFHGENVFLCPQKGAYAVIDWALASEDGLLFFDDSYFELSLLLHTAKDVSLDKWTDTISDVSRENWPQVSFTGKERIEEIHKTENQWIDQVSDASFSHVDKMKLTQSISRVIAGLNFAGKKKLDDTLREMAFLFSCIYLKKLFEQLGYTQWRQNDIRRWGLLANAAQSNLDMDAVKDLAVDCAQFNGQQYRYILICGNSQNYSSDIADCLARIPWIGVISLSRKPNEALYTSISRGKLLRNLLVSQTNAELKNNICHGAAWWMFADGVKNNSDTCFDTFAQWRNKTIHFLEDSIANICATTSPQDLKIIIDVDSFSGNDWEKAKRILEYFDRSEATVIELAVLSAKEDTGWDPAELEHIQLMNYPVGMLHLASFAATYLGAVRTNGIWLPHIDKTAGVQMDETDEKFVSTYIEIIGDHLLNKASAFEVKHSFFWGETISWDAIEEGIPVNRPEFDQYREMVEAALRDEKWGHINLGHTPGAGATILCRSVLWHMRNKYPALRIVQLGTDAYESLKRIAALSGLPLLILMDEDFTYGDVETLESFLRSALIKFVILYTYRRYPSEGSTSSGNFGKYLTILDSATAESFESHYCAEIEQKAVYSEHQLTIRRSSLRSLTTDQSLLEFRLPFFYGMYAFEEDFVSISNYTEQIIERMNEDANFCKAVSYIAIITYFTKSEGLSGKIAKKILKQSGRSTNQVLKYLYERLPNFIYVSNNSFRICHPVIAHKVLLNLYGVRQKGKLSLSCSKFADLCVSFIQDIRNMEGGDEPSDYANNLIANIFITRGFAEADDNGKDTAKKSFSSIILEISKFALQKDVFECLVRNFPKNPHCFQHYGRLLINNMPNDLVSAREQFNKAIQLDGVNPLHFHARGNMYRKYCKNLLETKFKGSDVSPQEIFDGCKDDVDHAIEDFKSAADFAIRGIQTYQSYSSFNLAYPYSSILNICTMIIRSIQDHYKRKYDADDFWKQDVEYVIWCRELLAIANQYDFSVDDEHTEVMQDDFYRKARKGLATIKFSNEELLKLIDRQQNDVSLKIIYLGRTSTRKDALKKKSQEELSLVCKYCEDIFSGLPYADGGLIWKWFNSYILTSRFDRTHAIGVLESLPDFDDNLTATYLLYVLYFCQFCDLGRQEDADMAMHYLSLCKELGKNNPQRVSSKFFLAESNPALLTTDRAQASKYPCTIMDEVTQEQSAMMTLDEDPRFKVFFVPFYNKAVKVGQGFNLAVNATIGFSFSGLRGFELELRNAMNDGERQGAE